MADTADTANVIVRPPIAWALAVLAGLALNWLMPLPFLPAAISAGWLGAIVFVLALALPQIKAGRVRALGVAAKERVAVLPEVPTLTEQGFAAEVGGWFGVLAPAGTPPEAIAWLNREITKVFSAPDTRDRFVQQGAAVPLGTPETFGKFIEAESARYGDIIQRAGIKLE